jgi:hypothetical protein
MLTLLRKLQEIARCTIRSGTMSSVI